MLGNAQVLPTPRKSSSIDFGDNNGEDRHDVCSSEGNDCKPQVKSKLSRSNMTQSFLKRVRPPVTRSRKGFGGSVRMPQRSVTASEIETYQRRGESEQDSEVEGDEVSTMPQGNTLPMKPIRSATQLTIAPADRESFDKQADSRPPMTVPAAERRSPPRTAYVCKEDDEEEDKSIVLASSSDEDDSGCEDSLSSSMSNVALTGDGSGDSGIHSRSSSGEMRGMMFRPRLVTRKPSLIEPVSLFSK